MDDKKIINIEQIVVVGAVAEAVVGVSNNGSKAEIWKKICLLH